MSSECDASAPYCIGGSCDMTCTDDTQCPGFGQDASDTFCVSGGCVACRVGMNDCPMTAPVCDMGACRACMGDADCASDVCDVANGMCVAGTSVIYAGPNGTDADPCTQPAPCTLSKALNLVDPQHQWVRMLDGSYTPGAVTISNKSVNLVATNATIVQSSGVAITLSSGAKVNIRALSIDARTATGVAEGIVCDPGAGTATLELSGVSVAMNPSATLQFAIALNNLCSSEIVSSSFAGSSGFSHHSTTMVDRSMFHGQLSVSGNMTNDTLGLHVTNSILVDPILAPDFNNPTVGAYDVYFAYDTLYTNQSSSALLICPTSTGVPATSVVLDDNILFAPNLPSAFVGGSGCTADTNVMYPESSTKTGTMAIIQDPKLVDPANGNFHLMLGSPAIDAAKPTASDPPVDYDGTTRPQGARDDIGALEYK